MNDQLFDMGDNRFQIVSHGVTLDIERLRIPGFLAYRVVFSSKRAPLVITRARNAELAIFWTVIPEGQARETEAQGVGKLIEEYYQQKSKE